VIISSGANAIQFSGSATIKSLQCGRDFQVASGNLTLTSGVSLLSGTLAISAGALLSAEGTNTFFSATGSTTADGASLFALAGGTLLLPALSNLATLSFGEP